MNGKTYRFGADDDIVFQCRMERDESKDKRGPVLVARLRPTLNRLAHWNLNHRQWVRLALGGGVVVMGLLILATV